MSTTHHLTKSTILRSLVVAVAAGLLPVAAATGSAQAAASCSVTWGSLAKSSATMVPGPVTNVRAGRHTCFDRLVVDVKGRAAGYTVKYVGAVLTEGQGAVVSLRGGAKLLVVVRAPDYGAGSFTPANRREVVNVAGFSTFRQVADAGSFEGQTSLGLGVRARLPFRAFTIQDATTSRLVIDVAHHW